MDEGCGSGSKRAIFETRHALLNPAGSTGDRLRMIPRGSRVTNANLSKGAVAVGAGRTRFGAARGTTIRTRNRSSEQGKRGGRRICRFGGLAHCGVLSLSQGTPSTGSGWPFSKLPPSTSSGSLSQVRADRGLWVLRDLARPRHQLRELGHVGVVGQLGGYRSRQLQHRAQAAFPGPVAVAQELSVLGRGG